MQTEEGTYWFPVIVNRLDELLIKAIHRGCGFTHVYALRRNIAYNLQYLEYLDRAFQQIEMTSVINKQNIKMFIIVGCGVIESLLTFLLIKSGNHKMTQWALKTVMPGQEKNMGDNRTRIDSHVYVKLLSLQLDQMDFDSIIKRSEHKKLLGADHGIYAKLNYLRKLRNKVYLHVIDQPTDHDWNTFQHVHLCAMAQVIYATFTGSIFRPSQEQRHYFAYLEKYLSQQLDVLDKE